MRSLCRGLRSPEKITLLCFSASFSSVFPLIHQGRTPGGKATGFKWEGELTGLKSSVVSGGKCWSHQLCPGDGIRGQVPASFSVCGCVWPALLKQGLAAERFRNNHVTHHSAQTSPPPPCRIRPRGGRQIFHLWTTD